MSSSLSLIVFKLSVIPERRVSIFPGTAEKDLREAVTLFGSTTMPRFTW